MAEIKCAGCEQTVPVNLHGPWCDFCGGVASRPGSLLLRHVATLDGEGGRYPICFDNSTSDYTSAYERTSPSPFKRDMDGFQPHHLACVLHGSLDSVIAAMQPVARGGSVDLPSLFAAPQATPEELKLLAL